MSLNQTDTHTIAFDKRLALQTGLGFLFVSILGTLSHFFYDWSGGNPFVGLFTPVNESTWEHIKLLFFPMLLYSLYLICRWGKRYPGLPCASMSGLLTGCLLIPVLFYSYSGILGYSITAVDISIFYISTAAAFRHTYRKGLRRCPSQWKPLLLALVLLLALAFLYFTHKPPSIGLFIPPE